MRTLIVLLMGQISLAQSWNVEKNVSDHVIYPGSHCTSFTSKATVSTRRSSSRLKSGQATLEVIALEGNAQQLKQPFVQVLLKADRKIPKGIDTLSAKDRRGNKLRLDLVIDETKDIKVFLGKLDERETLIQAIKELSNLELTMSTKGKSQGRLIFSLRGSSKAVSRQFKECDLEIRNHQEIK